MTQIGDIAWTAFAGFGALVVAGLAQEDLIPFAASGLVAAAFMLAYDRHRERRRNQ